MTFLSSLKHPTWRASQDEAEQWRLCFQSLTDWRDTREKILKRSKGSYRWDRCCWEDWDEKLSSSIQMETLLAQVWRIQEETVMDSPLQGWIRCWYWEVLLLTLRVRRAGQGRRRSRGAPVCIVEWVELLRQGEETRRVCNECCWRSGCPGLCSLKERVIVSPLSPVLLLWTEAQERWGSEELGRLSHWWVWWWAEGVAALHPSHSYDRRRGTETRSEVPRQAECLQTLKRILLPLLQSTTVGWSSDHDHIDCMLGGCRRSRGKGWWVAGLVCWFAETLQESCSMTPWSTHWWHCVTNTENTGQQGRYDLTGAMLESDWTTLPTLHPGSTLSPRS